MNSTENIGCAPTGNMPTKSVEKQENVISGIYKIINKINGKYYVGSSVNIKLRWRKHIEALKRNQHRNRYLQRAWNKYGEPSFEFVICENAPINQLTILEQQYLDIAQLELNKVYNLSFLSDRIEMTESVKNILSNMAKERFTNKENHPFYGKHHNNKTKQILKIKCANPGNKNGRFDPKIYEFINDNTNEVFVGTRYDFCQKYSIHGSRVSAVILKLGRSKRIHGWRITLKVKTF